LEVKDVFTVGISMISLLIAITSLYLTQFRPPRVTVSTGPMIHLFYVKPDEPTIFLPVVFHNASPTKAIVYKVFLELKDTKGDYFALKWYGSVKIDQDNNYTNTGLAGPFKIDGYETIPNALRLIWFNGRDNQQLEWLEGDYELTLHIWTSSSVQPDYSTSDVLQINDQVAAIMAEKKAQSDNTSRFLPLQGKSLISFATGKKKVDFSVLRN
jgi:hypothetical protein